MKIADIMTEKILKVRMEDSFGTIRDILENVHFHHLLVVDGRKLMGVVSDRDVLKALAMTLKSEQNAGHQFEGLEHKKVHQFMTRNPIVTNKETPVNVAAQIMLKNDISCLPVLAADGRIDGIVTMRDVIHAITTNTPRTGM